MKSYLLSLSFLTIIPVPFTRISSEGGELSRAASAFPLAGATLGLLLAGFAFIAVRFFPPAPVAVMVLIINFFLTRGLHLDGLADTADGLVGTTDREKAFRAMDDSAVGVMGVAAILFVSLLKFTLLSFLDSVHLVAVLFLMPLAGRWTIVNAGAWFNPARDRGLGDLFLRDLHWPVLLKASLWGVLLVFLFVLWQPLLVYPALIGCLAALVAGFLLALYGAHRLGGISGDILGACSEVGELFLLLCFCLVLQV